MRWREERARLAADKFFLGDYRPWVLKIGSAAFVLGKIWTLDCNSVDACDFLGAISNKLMMGERHRGIEGVLCANTGSWPFFW